MRITQRAQRIEPFYVMEVAKAASAVAAQVAQSESPMIFLNIGEPDFTAPPLVQEAATKAIHDGLSHYTQATGLPELRERISAWYTSHFGVNVPPSRIVVTAGASAALQLACLALIEAGDEVLMPDPSYPCNRQFVSAADGTAVLIPTTAAERFQLSADKVAEAWNDKTRGVLLASPSNPTGTSIAPDELRRIHAVVQARGGVTMVDEIYLPLSFDAHYGQTALALHVVQGERDLVADCRSLARFELRGIPPMPAGAARIRVTFTVDADGLLSVSAREQQSGVEAHMTVKPSYGLNDEQITQMLKTSFAMAEADMTARALVQARVDADRMILATQGALLSDGDMLSVDQRVTIEHLMGNVQAVCNQIDAAAIEAATQALAQGTASFAALRMNRSIQKALSGRDIHTL